MGRRKTAKTGDRAVYNSRPSGSKNNKPTIEDDEFIRVENPSDDDFSAGDDQSSNSRIAAVQNVMDLGIEEESDTSDDTSEDGENTEELLLKGPHEEAEDSSVSSASEDDDSSPLQKFDSKLWGKKKSLYYHGDTADIEIGQDKEDAFDEEEAAKEIESSRFHVMEDDDFLMEDHFETEGVAKKIPQLHGDASISASRDVSNLSSKAKRKFIKKQHPELLPLVAHFSDVCKDCKEIANAASSILHRSDDVIKSVGATKEGRKYLITKSLVGNSAALNVAIYLLLKQGVGVNVGDRRTFSGIQSHPVMTQLQRCMVFADSLNEDVTKRTSRIENQVSYLVQAIRMMDQESTSQEDDGATSDLEEESSGTSVVAATSPSKLKYDQDFEARDGNAVSPGKTIEAEARLMNEAKFGLRASEVKRGSKNSKRRKESADNYFGDMKQEEVRRKKHFLASTINTLEQKCKKQRKPDPEDFIDETEEESALGRGLNMMEEELHATTEKEEKERYHVDHVSEELNGEGGDFYSAVAVRSKERKAMKKKLYHVAPKFPGIVSEVSGERAISRAMMKNRGLVAHKAKINRNPRVKKREQYRKALIRRKGSIREVKNPEAHNYGGEETGVKTSISRSRKL